MPSPSSGRCPGQTELSAQPSRPHPHYSFQVGLHQNVQVLLLLLFTHVSLKQHAATGKWPPVHDPEAVPGGVPGATHTNTRPIHAHPCYPICYAKWTGKKSLTGLTGLAERPRHWYE
ncbi:hypothetical protein CGRA01v4_13243 [Colletotrichum graminicola]|nr:hypothetical protein CGRA01v4_13243 [Colletotrichum graminicola]